MKTVSWKWIVPAAFLVLTAVFFYKAFLGYSFQGADTPLGVMKTSARQVHLSTAVWSDSVWMGFRSNVLSVNPYTLFLKFLPAEAVQFAVYFLSVFLALVFMYLFLKKLGLEGLSPVFGAIAYAFTPHFLTVATAAHVTVTEMLMFPPMIFYFLTVVFDPAPPASGKRRIRTWLSLTFAGISWGMMMGDDPQRGLYFSLAAAAYIIYLVIRKNGIGFKNFFKTVFTRSVLVDVLKTAAILAVLLLVFLPSLSGWIDALKLRSAQTETISDPKAAEQAKWDLSTGWSFHPLELVDSFAFGYHGNMSGDPQSPYWGRFEYMASSESLGYFVIFFALIGIFAFIGRKNPVALFFGIGLAALILSFGRFLPGKPLYWLFYKIPLMSNFRAPAKFISVVAFCAAVLSAYGFSFVFRLMADDRDKQNRMLSNLMKIVAVLAGIALIWLFYVLVVSNDMAFSIGQKLNASPLGQAAVTNIILSLVRTIIFTALAFGVIFLFRKFRDRKFVLEGSALAFTLLLLVDLWSINWFYVDKAYFKPSEFYREDGVIMYLQGQMNSEIFRVATSLHVPVRGQMQSFPSTALRGYDLTFMFPYFGIQPLDITAISGVDPEYNNFFLRAVVGSLVKPLQSAEDAIDSNIRLFQLANVKYLIIDVPTTNSNLVLSNIVRGYDGRDHYLYAVKGYLPRVGFYSGYQMVTNNTMEGMFFIGDANVSVQKEAVVVGPSNATVPSKDAVAGQRLISYSPGRVKAEIIAPTDGLVLFTTKYDRDWKAFLNGKSVPVAVANYAQMGVLVPAGRHQLEFRFEPNPAPFTAALATVLAGLAGAAVYGIALLARRGGKQS